MIHEPPIDVLAEKVGSKYALCVIVSKRARQLIDTAQNQGYTELPGDYKKPITAAAWEVMNGKVTVAKF